MFEVDVFFLTFHHTLEDAQTQCARRRETTAAHRACVRSRVFYSFYVEVDVDAHGDVDVVAEGSVESEGPVPGTGRAL